MLFDSESLPPGTELWVSDYIENFSTFSSLELQQDYYNKTQVAIFITLVIRHREPNEAVLPSEVPLTLTLPLTLPYPTLPYPTLPYPTLTIGGIRVALSPHVRCACLRLG